MSFIVYHPHAYSEDVKADGTKEIATAVRNFYRCTVDGIDVVSGFNSCTVTIFVGGVATDQTFAFIAIGPA